MRLSGIGKLSDLELVARWDEMVTASVYRLARLTRLAFLLQWRRRFPPQLEVDAILDRNAETRRSLATRMRAAEELHWVTARELAATRTGLDYESGSGAAQRGAEIGTGASGQ